jgi:excisionase family DNA binding protein
MLSLNEVASVFEVHPGTIRRWCRQGKIKAYHKGQRNRLFFKHEDVAVVYIAREVKKCLGYQNSG